MCLYKLLRSKVVKCASGWGDEWVVIKAVLINANSNSKIYRHSDYNSLENGTSPVIFFEEFPGD
jgi:hypothetical protein